MRLNAAPAPFSYPVPCEQVRIPGTFVSTADAKPLRAGSITSKTIDVAKVVAVTCASQDLMRFGGLAAEGLIRRRLPAAVSAGIDAAFCSATDAHSIITGLSATAGSTSLATDLPALLTTYLARGGSAENAVLLLSSANALGARMTANVTFETLGPTGGVAGGIPALASDAVGSAVILADRSQVLLADGELVLDATTGGAIEMSDTPTNDGGSPPVSTTLVSLFQNDLVALRAEKFINWTLSAGGAAYVATADYIA